MLRRAPLPVLLFALLSAPLVTAQPSAAWQQDVAYTMDVRLDPARHHLTGHQRLVYTNHSPDTLRQVYYHLFFNAFQPNSEMATYARRLPDPDRRTAPRIFHLGPEEIGHQQIHALTQDGTPVAFLVTDTILEVDLAAPLLPGAATVFEMDFEAQVPLQTRRSGRDNREGIDYTMTQWYPKMAAYDARGWHAEPYVGREFYAPFGTFDVRITLPAAYVVGATGVLQNPEAVGHGYDEPADAGLTSSGPTRPDSLTWHFRAERVHDFAWSADPDYRHVQALVQGIPGRDTPVALHVLFQPDVAEQWQPAAAWTATLLRYYSARFGPYDYPQFTVAQGGDGGMEYPMFTAITGRRSPTSLFGVIAHELAHEWFYGMLGSDEVAYAWMDEGFADFADAEATAWAENGGTAPTDSSANHRKARTDIVQLQRLGLYEPPNTFANDFATNKAYATAAYDGGRALLDLLGYVMGDDVRDAFLRDYVARFKFRHPMPDDVQAVAEAASGLRLGWLFGPFLDEGARYDYGIDTLNVTSIPTGSRSAITLRRHEPGVLPVALRLRYDDGSEEDVTIPVAEAGGHKVVPDGWTVAAPWAVADPAYTLTVERAHPVHAVTLDPEGRMIDLDPANNHSERR